MSGLRTRLGPRNQIRSSPVFADVVTARLPDRRRFGENLDSDSEESDSERMTTSLETKNQVRGWRFWAPRLATAMLLPVLLLGIAEGALRLFGVGFPTDLTVPCTMQSQPASCYNLFFPAPFFPPGMIKTPQAYAIPAKKPRGTFRIFVLGESAAMGDPDPAYGFSRYLEVMLRERFPALKFEVVNTGSVAINSHVLLPIARGLANQRPDLFIIYSGNNEVVGPYGPGTALTSSAMSLPVIRGSIFARSTRLGQLLTKVGTQKREWGGMEMFLDKQVPARSPLMAHVYANFESSLRDTIAIARGSGARVIVATVATNLKDCAPFASLHREDLGQDALRSWSVLVQQGSNLETARSYADALKAYLSAGQIDDQYAELEFRIARCLWMLGHYRAAREHFLRARDLDTLRFRADSKINDINRSVAASSPGAELVDADEIFAKQSPNGIVGSELVYEHVHMTPEGNYLLARAMFSQIASKLPAETGQAPSLQEEDVSHISSQAECEQLLAFTPHDRLRIAREMLERLQKPPFTTQLNHSDQVLRLTIKADAPDESPDETVAEYQWAIRKKPDDRILHYNFGLFLFDYNRTGAAEQLRMSRAWDGFPVFAPDGTPLE
jgi:tetratricopeptide (TPR) repeat protein